MRREKALELFDELIVNGFAAHAWVFHGARSDGDRQHQEPVYGVETGGRAFTDQFTGDDLRLVAAIADRADADVTIGRHEAGGVYARFVA